MPRKTKRKPKRKPKPGRKPGRPTKLTPELARRIVKLIESGNYILTAASACGCSRQNFYNWLDRGRAELAAIDKGTEPNPDEEIFAEFAARVDVAAAKSEIDAVADVRKQTERWQASMTYLERRFPDRWGRRQAIEHSGPQGGAIPLRAFKPAEIAAASTETLKAIAEGRALPQAADDGTLHPADEGGPDRGGERSGGES